MVANESFRGVRNEFGSLELTFSLDEGELRVGRSGHGRVRLRNSGTDLIEFVSEQPIVASVLNPSTMRQVGWYHGWIAGTGLQIRLAPGETASIAVLVGTDPRMGAAPSQLAPGEFLVRAAVSVLELRPDEDGYDRNQLACRAVPITLVAR